MIRHLLDLRALLSLPLLAMILLLISALDQWLFVAIEIPPYQVQILAAAVFIMYGIFFLVTEFYKEFHVSKAIIIAGVLIILYIIYSILSLMYGPNDEIAFDLLADRMKAGIFLLFIMSILLWQPVRQGLEVVVLLPLSVAIMLNIFDFFVPTFSVVPGRAAGLYLNPNDAGVMIIFMGLIASARLRPLWNFVLWAAISAAVLLTFSRGAWLVLVVALVGLVLAGHFGRGKARFFFVAGVAALLLGTLIAYLSGDLYYAILRSPFAGYFDDNTLARLGARGLAIDDFSAMEREAVFYEGIEAYFQSPLIGHGVGYTHTWEMPLSTHNMLVLMGAELGTLGVAVYLVLFGLMIVGNSGIHRVHSLCLLLAGMFTHNQFDAIALIIPIAFALSTMGLRDAPLTRRPPDLGQAGFRAASRDPHLA